MYKAAGLYRAYFITSILLHKTGHHHKMYNTLMGLIIHFSSKPFKIKVLSLYRLVYGVIKYIIETGPF